mmetsp:Transcript_89802/g.159704  ORF Transcript_89802/g.159704 Transcript_89802/m.159704 type:complete len:87 (+) Transcript_89802:755-1015(+)
MPAARAVTARAADTELLEPRGPAASGKVAARLVQLCRDRALRGTETAKASAVARIAAAKRASFPRKMGQERRRAIVGLKDKEGQLS